MNIYPSGLTSTGVHDSPRNTPYWHDLRRVSRVVSWDFVRWTVEGNQLK
jgi:hypothetical protein